MSVGDGREVGWVGTMVSAAHGPKLHTVYKVRILSQCKLHHSNAGATPKTRLPVARLLARAVFATAIRFWPAVTVSDCQPSQTRAGNLVPRSGGAMTGTTGQKRTPLQCFFFFSLPSRHCLPPPPHWKRRESPSAKCSYSASASYDFLAFSTSHPIVASVPPYCQK